MVEKNDTEYEDAQEYIDGYFETVKAEEDKLESAMEDATMNSELELTFGLVCSWKAINYYSLPSWMQDNDFLHQSHRPQLPSFAVCFKSIFRLHSETGNIWTHLLGCVIFLITAVYFLSRPEQEIQWEDKFVFLPFFIGAIGCMLLSFLFHTFYCHSESMNKFFAKLDYVGIALMITGSSIPWCYYAFYCDPNTRNVYVSLLCVVSLISMYLSMYEKFMSANFRSYRVAFFITTGFCAVIPVIHLTSIHGFEKVFYDYSVGWILLMGLTYIVGAVFYACRVPERFFPGRCDLWFQSHQIFHVAVILASFIHYHAINVLAERKFKTPCEGYRFILFSWSQK